MESVLVVTLDGRAGWRSSAASKPTLNTKTDGRVPDPTALAQLRPADRGSTAGAGNVAKALASSYVGCREVARLFAKDVAQQELAEQAERENAWVRFAEVLEDVLKAARW